jgi:SPP1 gp7 family putative phage head morphogenesis protein
MTDENGELVSFGKFRQSVIPLDQEFNDSYLQTEYNSVIASSQMAEKWESLQQFDMLEYRTVGDNRVRKKHEELDGLVLSSNDPLWRKIYPPNDWNCRCTVIPAPGASETNRKAADQFSKGDGLKPYFSRNVGVEKTVFKDDHPYFTRLKSTPMGNKKDVQFLAEENYNMPSVEKIYKRGKLPVMPEANSMEDAFKQWEKQIKETIRSVDGVDWEFTNQWNHVVKDHGSEDRWKYINNAREVLQNPDEVWSSRVVRSGKTQVFKRYVKYYDSKPIVFSHDVDEPNAWTIYSADQNDAGEFENLRMHTRKGVLLYRK